MIGTPDQIGHELKVGMLVETNGNGDSTLKRITIRGHIVHMNSFNIYIGTDIDTHSGCGEYLEEARKYGYSKTWQVTKSNNVAWIKIVEMTKLEKVEIGKRYIVKDIFHLLKVGMKVKDINKFPVDSYGKISDISNKYFKIKCYGGSIITLHKEYSGHIEILETPEETKTIWNMLDTRMKELENTLATSELPMHTHTVGFCCEEIPSHTHNIITTDNRGLTFTDEDTWFIRSTAEFIKQPEENKMSLIYKFKQLFTTEPTKSLKKAGFIDDNSFLTSEGGAVLLKWLLDKNIDAFKAEVVDPIIKEMDKE
jgi:hypothetical protein